MEERIEAQLSFLWELEKMKNVYRQTYVLYEDRTENDAEHSFHLAVMAAILSEYANEPVDVTKVMKMTLVHDAVEVYAGDTYAYDEEGAKTKEARETDAARKLFSKLPREQAEEYGQLWAEFEARESAEAKFANALDRFQPLLMNYLKGGKSWQEHGIKAPQVKERCLGVTGEGSRELARLAERIIDAAVREGKLPSGEKERST